MAKGGRVAAPRDPKVVWQEVKAKLRPRAYRGGSIEWTTNKRGYHSLRGRLRHRGRTILTESIGLGPQPTKGAIEDAADEAVRRLDKLVESLRQGYRPDPARERRTVGAQMQRWLTATEQTAPQGHDYYEQVVKRHITPYGIADVPLRELTAEDVEHWLSELVRAKVPSATRQFAFDRLMEALRQFLIPAEVPSVRAVLNAAKTLRPKHRKGKPQPFDEEQTDQLLRYLTSGDAREPYASLLAVQLLNGLRWGEAAGIRIDDLHRLGSAEPYVTIAQRIDKDDRKPYPVKSEAGERQLPLSSATVAVLRDYLEREAVDGRPRRPGELVFQYRGKPVNYRTTLNNLFQATEAAGLGRLGKTHRLRHTFGTLGGLETPTHVLGGIMGHTDNKTTLIYTSRRQKDMREATEKISRRMRNEKPPDHREATA